MLDRLRGPLVRNIGWAAGAEIIQMLISSGVFFVLAALLTVAEFGLYSATLALAFIGGSVASFGAHILLVQRVNQGSDLSSEWPRSLGLVAVGDLLAFALLMGLRSIVLPEVGALTFALLVLAQLNFHWIVELAVHAGVAVRRLDLGAKARLLVGAARALLLLMFWLGGTDSLERWAVHSFAASLAGSIVAVLLIGRALGLPVRLRPPNLSDLRFGSTYGLNSATEGVLDAVDRPLLVRYGFDDGAGHYSVAARVSAMAVIAQVALIRASDADLYEAAARGPRAALAVVRKMAIPSVGVGALTGLGMAIGAPLVPLVVGDKFDPAVPLIQALAVVPMVKGLQYFLGNVLTAVDRQPLRFSLTIAAMLFNLIGNIILLPRHGAAAAVGTTIASEIGLLGLFWLALRYIVIPDHDRRPDPAPDTEPPPEAISTKENQ
ncbi:MAG: lipopolysaccharide biosynthesis protein [Actinomycetia bacterium]|nr:lipopolysaccharide biosynthesis protein [Actinomycetes bacterium]